MTDELAARSSAARGGFACVCCGAEAWTFQYRIGPRNLVRCRRCGLLRQLALPAPEALAALYSSERYYRTPDFLSGDPERIYGYSEGAADPRLRARHFRERLAPILRAHLGPAAGRRWLDVGCGLGDLVAFARREGFEACGIDPNPAGVAAARSAHGDHFRVASLEDLPIEERFAVVSAFDVIEHVLDPQAFLRAVRARLAAGGHALVATPDARSLPSRLLGPRLEDFRRVSEHFFLFSRENLTLLAARCGLSLVHASSWGALLPLREALARGAAMLHLHGTWRALRLERAIPAGASVHVDPHVKMLVVLRAE